MTLSLSDFVFDQGPAAPLMRAAEDPLAGLRLWKLVSANGRVELGSTVSDSTWPAGGENRAERGKGHRAGAADCS